jgi:hypothetical protein
MIEFISPESYDFAKRNARDTGFGWEFQDEHYSHFWSPYPYRCIYIKTKNKDDLDKLYENKTFEDRMDCIKLINRREKLELC